MYTRFKIRKAALEEYLFEFRREHFPDVYSEDEQLALARAREVIMASSHDGIVEATQMKDGFFPTNFRNQYQVFISHSHKDIDLVKKFANVLKAKFDVRCFVDSMVWENMEKLLAVIDEKYCKNKKTGNYYYQNRNLSTAHVHAMLTIALMEMIEQCECCIFIQSDNSTIPSLKLRGIEHRDKTFSPWIYEEINFMNMLEPRESQRLLKLFSNLNENEQRAINGFVNPAVPIIHRLDLDKFKEVKPGKIPYNFNKDETWLDALYRNMGMPDYKLNQRLL